MGFNPLNAELNPICQLLALLGAHHILHVSSLRVNSAFKGLTLYITVPLNCYICEILSENDNTSTYLNKNAHYRF